MTAVHVEQLLVLLGIVLNAGALVYAFYVRSPVYAVVFGAAMAYLIYRFYARYAPLEGSKAD